MKKTAGSKEPKFREPAFCVFALFAIKVNRAGTSGARFPGTHMPSSANDMHSDPGYRL